MKIKKILASVMVACVSFGAAPILRASAHNDVIVERVVSKDTVKLSKKVEKQKREIKKLKKEVKNKKIKKKGCSTLGIVAAVFLGVAKAAIVVTAGAIVTHTFFAITKGISK